MPKTLKYFDRLIEGGRKPTVYIIIVFLVLAGMGGTGVGKCLNTL
jgi:hypothetical protein